MEDEKTIVPEQDIRQAVKTLNLQNTVGPGMRRALAIAGSVCSLAGWCAFFFSPLVAMVLACAGFVMSLIGAVLVGKGCLRDIAITFTVASFVLIIVYALFHWGVPAAVNSL